MDKLAGDPSLKRLQRTKLLRNADAIAAYEKIYGDRHFELLPKAHRLQLNVAGVTITAQPDLWVREGTIEVIIKIGVQKKKQPELFMELMLHLLRKAAIATGYKVRARNVAFLDVTSGDERICQITAVTLQQEAGFDMPGEIAQIWPDITQVTKAGRRRTTV